MCKKHSIQNPITYHLLKHVQRKSDVCTVLAKNDQIYCQLSYKRTPKTYMDELSCCLIFFGHECMKVAPSLQNRCTFEHK